MSHGSLRVVLTALAANIGIALIKTAAGLITGSAALIAEAAHSFVDCENEGLLLLGLQRSKKKPDKHYQMGHERELYLWSLPVALALFIGGGVFCIVDGVQGMRHPHEERMLHVLGYDLPGWTLSLIVLLLSGSLEIMGFLSAWASFRAQHRNPGWTAFKNSDDPATFIVLVEDGLAVIGLSIAAAGILVGSLTRYHWADGFSSVIIGFLLIIASTILLHEVMSLCIGESEPVINNAVHNLLSTDPHVTHINHIKTERHGPDSTLVLISVDLEDHITAGTLENLVEHWTQTLQSTYPQIKNIYLTPRKKS